MSRETLVTILDHGKSAVLYVGFGAAIVVAAFMEREDVVKILSAFMAGGGGVQGLSGLASAIKKGGRAL